MKRIGILMAGGAGERFWPISRRKRPKQLLPLNTERTLIEEAIDRVSSLLPREDIYIITNEIIFESIRSILRNFPPENIIPEPNKRNTAPCLALACGFILAKYGNWFKPEEISIGVFTSDQKINPLDGFIRTTLNAFQFVEKNSYLATIGIPPSRPETAFGYIEVAENIHQSQSEIMNVIRFHEKPNREKAEEYLQSGNYFWNSGMFFWRLDTFLQEFNLFCPEISNKIPLISEIFKCQINNLPNVSSPELSEFYAKFPDISIDYALMEKTNKIVVAKAFFEWDDIGSWDALDRTKNKDAYGNISIGNNVILDTSNSIVYNHSSNGKIKLAAIGLNDFVVVIDDDAVLICPKSQVQKVKNCVELIKKSQDGIKWL